MKKLITISCLLLIVNLSNAQNIYELKIDKKMDKNNRPTIDSGFDILHLEEYKDYLLKSIIRKNVALSECIVTHQSIFDYSKNANGAKDYSNLAEEIMKKEGIR